jgi:hypothetical protein
MTAKLNRGRALVIEEFWLTAIGIHKGDACISSLCASKHEGLTLIPLNGFLSQLMNWAAQIGFADTRSEAGISWMLEHPECAFVFRCSRVISSTGAILPYPKQERVEHEHYKA